jgi:hypothetical protein
MGRLGAFVTTAALALVPLAASAQSMDDTVGKPFPLWIFLLAIAGVIALVAAYAAKGAVEKR